MTCVPHLKIKPRDVRLSKTRTTRSTYISDTSLRILNPSRQRFIIDAAIWTCSALGSGYSNLRSSMESRSWDLSSLILPIKSTVFLPASLIVSSDLSTLMFALSLEETFTDFLRCNIEHSPSLFRFDFVQYLGTFLLISNCFCPTMGYFHGVLDVLVVVNIWT